MFPLGILWVDKCSCFASSKFNETQGREASGRDVFFVDKTKLIVLCPTKLIVSLPMKLIVSLPMKLIVLLPMKLELYSSFAFGKISFCTFASSKILNVCGLPL